jgi:hypothetical protein
MNNILFTVDSEGVPLLLLGPSKDVSKVIKGALEKPIPEVENEVDLESVLQEITSKFELKDVVSPLLGNKDPENNESTTKRR